jgi:hypothetical protein
MEAAEGTGEQIESPVVEVGTPRKVTEVEECRNTFDNIGVHKTMDSR